MSIRRVLGALIVVAACSHGFAALDPKGRGAGDMAFVTPPLPAIDGLGLRGGGAHAPSEWADLSSAPELVKRTAILVYRLTR
ncbi:MAG: hypothetical protein HS122_01430 [Opitutaceae bacterium]|nr:hypothetical protein [Opitutaceae bacterium]